VVALEPVLALAPAPVPVLVPGPAPPVLDDVVGAVCEHAATATDATNRGSSALIIRPSYHKDHAPSAHRRTPTRREDWP
jgi:hypothetical protein